jgi:hypothetical protein
MVAVFRFAMGHSANLIPEIVNNHPEVLVMGWRNWVDSAVREIDSRFTFRITSHPGSKTLARSLLCRGIRLSKSTLWHSQKEDLPITIRLLI